MNLYDGLVLCGNRPAGRAYYLISGERYCTSHSECLNENKFEQCLCDQKWNQQQWKNFFALVWKTWKRIRWEARERKERKTEKEKKTFIRLTIRWEPKNVNVERRRKKTFLVGLYENFFVHIFLSYNKEHSFSLANLLRKLQHSSWMHVGCETPNVDVALDIEYPVIRVFVLQYIVVRNWRLLRLLRYDFATFVTEK